MGKPPPPYQTPDSDVIVSTKQELEVIITTYTTSCSATTLTFNIVQVQANETAHVIGEWLLTNNQWAVALKQMKDVSADLCVVTFVSQVRALLCTNNYTGILDTAPFFTNYIITGVSVSLYGAAASDGFTGSGLPRAVRSVQKFQRCV